MRGTRLYFAALLPTEEQQALITEIKGHFSEKYHARHALNSPPHITVIPPFRWPEEKEGKLVGPVGGFASSQRPFDVMVNGFGAFGPRVVYAAIEPNEDLQHMRKKLLFYLKEQVGLDFENGGAKPFHPHITVAFKDLKPAAFYDAWKEFEQKNLNFEFLADGIALFKHDGHRWKKEAFLYFGK